MNVTMYKNYTKRRLFVLDELALVLAFFTALLIRYRHDFFAWSVFYDGLYVSVLVVAALVQALKFLAYDYRRPVMLDQELIKTVVDIVKGRLFLLIAIIIYLYMIQQGVNSSRFVIPATVMLDAVYEFVFRSLYKLHYISRYGKAESRTLELFYPYPGQEELSKKLESGYYDKALIHTYEHAISWGMDGMSRLEAGNIRSASDEETNELISRIESAGLHPYVALETLGYHVRNGIVSDLSDFASVPVSVRKERYNVFGVRYAIARTEEAVLHVVRHIKELSGKYICFSNVHTVVMAKEHKEYRDVLNDAALVFADGTPIAQQQQKNGYELAERIAGPDFMEHMFRLTADGSLSHYFYGSSQETLDALESNLKKKYPGLDIRGLYSPPFRALSEEEDAADVEMINASGADIIWIGLGAPKQEKWMWDHKDRVNGVMMGVGAGFDFHAGTIKRAPKWIQRIGFEWFYRLFQDPKRLIGRYFVTNVKYFWYTFLERFH